MYSLFQRLRLIFYRKDARLARGLLIYCILSMTLLSFAAGQYYFRYQYVQDDLPVHSTKFNEVREEYLRIMEWSITGSIYTKGSEITPLRL